MQILQLMERVPQSDGDRPFTYMGQVFYADPNFDHVCMDSDGEVHVFIGMPDRHSQDEDEVTGFYRSEEMPSRWVGVLAPLDQHDWILSPETIQWGIADEA